jgi:hypothetical protein
MSCMFYIVVYLILSIIVIYLIIYIVHKNFDCNQRSKDRLLFLFILFIFYRLVTDIPEARDIRFGG